MTVETVKNIAESNAAMALDEGCIESYRQNAMDTVTAQGGDYCDWQDVQIYFQRALEGK